MSNLTPLLDILRRQQAYRALLPRFAPGEQRLPTSLGVIPAGRPLAVAALLEDLSRHVLVIVANKERGRTFVEALQAFAPGRGMVMLEPEAFAFEPIPWSTETIGQRLAVLQALLAEREHAVAIVATGAAALVPLPPVAAFRERLAYLRPGMPFALSQLLQQLVENGYRRQSVADEPGTFAQHGGIVDYVPPGADRGVRCDFFGDMIEELRLYDPATQRSCLVVERALLGPACEAAAGDRLAAAAALRSVAAQNCHAGALQRLAEDLAALEQGVLPAAFAPYLALLYRPTASLLDYAAAAGTLVFVDDLSLVEAAVVAYQQAFAAAHARALEAGDVPEGLPAPLLPAEGLLEWLRHNAVELGTNAGEEAGPLWPIFSPVPHFAGQLQRALLFAAEGAERGSAVIVSRHARRLAELLRQRDWGAAPLQELSGPPRGLVLLEGSYPEGWQMATEQGELHTLLTDLELSGSARPAERRVLRRPKDPVELTGAFGPGDYVVHINHGVGRFRGLVRRTDLGVEKEYLEIEYAEGDRLYVPTHQADRVARYVGLGGGEPELTRLGGVEWELTKARAARAVESIADELLELYAARALAKGFACVQDDAWMDELERSFPYEETEDQLRAIEAVKRDLESGRPMDRLIAGDVGYGKTEVALRAAFKAVISGKQVAVLVPTTVLAQQHFETFRRRLAPFPVRVEMLCRFLADEEQDRVVSALARGEVDIVIGTHRLLQDDVRFKDLGLVIIDEEQRFGVRHKEHLKQLRREVHVLTLSATPIPRTLYMALAGLRDMCTIDTPPEDRQAITTFVSPWDDDLVQRAIRRELARGGQAFIVHDRVLGIEALAGRVRRLVPEAHIAIAHGQLPERALQEVMRAFVNREVDVLVCTTIIESGLDIPNANTIIINHADRFGLAQLYQLRGRVGRGVERGYAYLLFSPGQELTEAARERLRAIAELSQLGSGFQIAMRDLELRGAGEILGRRQHGHLAAIGLDLYTRLLARAVADRRRLVGGEPADQELRSLLRPLAPSVQLELPLPAEIPPEWVPDAGLRLSLYRRLASLSSAEKIDAFAQELADRFGPIPEPAANLLYIARIKALAERAGVQAIGFERGQVYIRMPLTWLQGADVRAVLAHGARLGRDAIWLGASADYRPQLLAILETLARLREDRALRRQPPTYMACVSHRGYAGELQN
jgi:transcription-repair coupling factor (superfamily II helicase)